MLFGNVPANLLSKIGSVGAIFWNPSFLIGEIIDFQIIS